MSFKSTAREAGGAAVIDISGRITLGEGSAMLREMIRDLLNKGQKKIVLNLAEVNYIDSSGIGELVSGFTAVRNQGGELKLLHLTRKVHDLLQITKLYTHQALHRLRRPLRRASRYQQLCLTWASSPPPCGGFLLLLLLTSRLARSRARPGHCCPFMPAYPRVCGSCNSVGVREPAAAGFFVSPTGVTPGKWQHPRNRSEEVEQRTRCGEVV